MRKQSVQLNKQLTSKATELYRRRNLAKKMEAPCAVEMKRQQYREHADKVVRNMSEDAENENPPHNINFPAKLRKKFRQSESLGAERMQV